MDLAAGEGHCEPALCFGDGVLLLAQVQEAPPETRPALRCLCGKSTPSRPHLLWCCSELAALRSGLELPNNRLEERLLAMEVQEIPAAPIVLSRDEYLAEMAEMLEARLGSGGPLFVATDGSAVASVAAWSAVLDGTGAGDFALGWGGPDLAPRGGRSLGGPAGGPGSHELFGDRSRACGLPGCFEGCARGRLCAASRSTCCGTSSSPAWTSPAGLLVGALSRQSGACSVDGASVWRGRGESAERACRQSGPGLCDTSCSWLWQKAVCRPTCTSHGVGEAGVADPHGRGAPLGRGLEPLAAGRRRLCHRADRITTLTQVAMNTTLSAATGGITVFLLRYAIMKKYDVGGLCNGILAGLVSITAGCGNVECGSAVAIGLLGGLVYQGSSMLLQKLKIDDPVDASPVHGFCGIWGALAAGLFDWGKGFDHYHGWSGFGCKPVSDTDSTCMTGIGGTAIAAQLIMVLVIILWAGTLSGLAFFALKMTGLLRIDEYTEEVGMDVKQHSPPKAYAIGAGAAASPVGNEVEKTV